MLHSLPGAWIDHEESLSEKKQDIDSLKQTIEKLEETNNIVKKSIQIVAEKRVLAEQAKSIRPKNEEYVIVNQESRPTQEELVAAGIEGWEWVSTAS